MTSNFQQGAVQQLDSVLTQFESLKRRSQFSTGDFSDLRGFDIQGFIVMALAAIDRVAGTNSSYSKQAHKLVDEGSAGGRSSGSLSIPALAGIVSALKVDVNSGFLNSIEDLIHGELFSDFLEMAEHLLSEKYKDAAAVIGGSVLEQHLRKLSTKNGIAITQPDGTYKKADTLNADLARVPATGQAVYSKNEQKIITGWLGIRNSAAHGNYTEYTKDHVDLMLQGIRNFMVRYSA